MAVYLRKDQSVQVLPEFTNHTDQNTQIYALQLKKDEDVRVVVCFNADQNVSLLPEFTIRSEQLVRILPGIITYEDQDVQKAMR